MGLWHQPGLKTLPSTEVLSLAILWGLTKEVLLGIHKVGSSLPRSQPIDSQSIEATAWQECVSYLKNTVIGNCEEVLGFSTKQMRMTSRSRRYLAPNVKHFWIGSTTVAQGEKGNLQSPEDWGPTGTLWPKEEIVGGKNTRVITCWEPWQASHCEVHPWLRYPFPPQWEVEWRWLCQAMPTGENSFHDVNLSMMWVPLIPPLSSPLDWSYLLSQRPSPNPKMISCEVLKPVVKNLSYVHIASLFTLWKWKILQGRSEML